MSDEILTNTGYITMNELADSLKELLKQLDLGDIADKTYYSKHEVDLLIEDLDDRISVLLSSDDVYSKEFIDVKLEALKKKLTTITNKINSGGDYYNKTQINTYINNINAKLDSKLGRDEMYTPDQFKELINQQLSRLNLDNYYTKPEADAKHKTLQDNIDNINKNISWIRGVPVFKAGKNDPYSQEPDKEGGEIQLIKADNSNLTMNIAIDSFYNYIRFFTKVGDKKKIAIINFPKLPSDKYNELCTADTNQVGNLEFFEPFALYSDRTYGAISRSGYNVHLNFLLANNGATTGNVCYLPVKARWCEIHMCGPYEFRTLNDSETPGSLGLLVLNGQLPNDGGYTVVDITYTADHL